MLRRLQVALITPLIAVWIIALSRPHSSPIVPPSNPSQTVAESSNMSGEHDFVAHVESLKKKLPSADFTIVVQAPFVVIGDEPAAAVKDHSERTVKWAVDKLKQEYFSQDPREILDIWLFKDAASYEKNAVLLFGEKPTTPYGYYSSRHKALVMNISTGGGTLVHEIVHPFVEANFPACPAWFNEGLGSLYEQSGEVNGHIHGYTNWRLPGLQRAINAGSVLSFKDFTALDTNSFYNGEHDRYAQARYLCYYLQQRGLLTKFYQQFHANQKDDPTGYQTLRRVLGPRVNMLVFQKRWEKFVLSLKQGYEVSVAP